MPSVTTFAGSAPGGAASGRVVVVGAGLAGLRTIEQLRRRGFTGAITLLGAEPHPPYDRPPLSKAMLGRDAKPTLLRKAGTWAELAVDARFGTTATALDPGRRQVVLDNGAPVEYDVLIIATGATPRRLPTTTQPGVHVLRTLDDCRRIGADVAAAHSLAVVGGGFIGCEVAASARTLGLQVTLIEALAAPLVRVFGTEVAGWVTELHERAGVRVQTGVGVERVVPTSGADGRVGAVLLRNGEEIAADVVLVGLGVTPDVAWLDGSGLDVRDGIRCDEHGRTSVPGVFALGDCASWRHVPSGTHRRLEHWTNAVEQAATVAQNVLGATPLAAHDAVPYFWSDQYDIKIQSLGWPDADAEVEIVERGDPAGGLAVYGRSGLAVAAVGFSCAGRLMRLRPLLTGATSVEQVVAAAQPPPA